MRYPWLVGLAIVCGLAAPVWAATVTFDLVPVTALTGNEVVVTPGQQVQYQLVATVVSDTPVADNLGLSLFQLNIETASGIAQDLPEAFSPIVVADFTAFPSLGTVQGDQIIGVSAAQLGLGTPFVQGIGVGQAVVLATGHFNTPTVETTFTPKVGPNSKAEVLGAGSKEGQSITATAVAGPGFTIRTSNTATGGGGDQSGTGSSGTSLLNPTAASAVGIAAGALIALAAAFSLFGPMGLALALVIVPLLGTLLLLLGG